MDSLSIQMNKIKKLCRICDTTNPCEVNNVLCDIIDICDEVD